MPLFLHNLSIKFAIILCSINLSLNLYFYHYETHYFNPSHPSPAALS